MKIYTRTGDHGETALLGGKRISKSDPRVCAYGTLDELNACLGLATAAAAGQPTTQILMVPLQRIQAELFLLGAELASPPGTPLWVDPLDTTAITRLEQEIDQMETLLPALKQFVLPGGTELAARLHLARTICRRAERELVALAAEAAAADSPGIPLRPAVLAYINRLSDGCFVMARYANHLLGVMDLPWKAPRKNGA